MLGFVYILVAKMIYFDFLWAKKLQKKKKSKKKLFLSQLRTQVIPYLREVGVPIVNQLGIIIYYYLHFGIDFFLK